jgi:hypothetical protein
MAMADRFGLPVTGYSESAASHKVTLVEPNLKARFTQETPERLIGDKGYDSDPLEERPQERGITLIAPHKTNRAKPKTQDGRALRHYTRRWKIERLVCLAGTFPAVAGAL